MTGPLTRKTYPLPVLPATPRAPAAGTLLILGYIRLLLGQVTPASASLFSCSDVHEPTLFVHSVFISELKLLGHNRLIANICEAIINLKSLPIDYSTKDI